MLCKQAKQFRRRAEDSFGAVDIQRDNALRRGFNPRRKSRRTIEQRRLCRLFLLWVPLAQNDPWALSCLGLGDAGFNSRNLGLLIACEDARQGIRAVEDCNGTIAPGDALLFRLATNGSLDGKARDEDAGKKHCLRPLPFCGETPDTLRRFLE